MSTSATVRTGPSLMRWRILLLLFLARIGLGLQFQTLGSVGDDLSRQFALSYAEVGVLIGLSMAPGLFLALPAGFAGRFVSDRAMATAGLACLALGGAISGFAGDSATIGAGRIVAGVGFVLSNIYLTKMVADWFAGREIATAMSIVIMSWPLGIAIGQIGHEWLAAVVDWRQPFIAASSYCCVGAAMLLAFYRAPERSTHGPAPAPSGLDRSELRLTLAAAAAWAVFNGGYVVYLSFAPLALEAQGQAPLAAATIVSVGSWIMVFSGAVMGWIADKTEKPHMVIALCMLGAVAAMFLLAVNGAGLAASLLLGLVGVAPAGVIMALAGQAMLPENRALGMGIVFTVYYAVMATAPALAGWIFDATARPLDPILLGAALFAAVLPALYVYRALQRRAAHRLTKAPAS